MNRPVLQVPNRLHFNRPVLHSSDLLKQKMSTNGSSGRDWLSDPKTFRNIVKDADKVDFIETHLSNVSLCGDYVFKSKKSVNHGPPFTDQTSLEERERLCREEIKKNKRTYSICFIQHICMMN